MNHSSLNTSSSFSTGRRTLNVKEEFSTLLLEFLALDLHSPPVVGTTSLIPTPPPPRVCSPVSLTALRDVLREAARTPSGTAFEDVIEDTAHFVFSLRRLLGAAVHGNRAERWGLTEPAASECELERSDQEEEPKRPFARRYRSVLESPTVATPRETSLSTSHLPSPSPSCGAVGKEDDTLFRLHSLLLLDLQQHTTDSLLHLNRFVDQISESSGGFKGILTHPQAVELQTVFLHRLTALVSSQLEKAAGEGSGWASFQAEVTETVGRLRAAPSPSCPVLEVNSPLRCRSASPSLSQNSSLRPSIGQAGSEFVSRCVVQHIGSYQLILQQRYPAIHAWDVLDAARYRLESSSSPSPTVPRHYSESTHCAGFDGDGSLSGDWTRQEPPDVPHTSAKPPRPSSASVDDATIPLPPLEFGPGESALERFLSRETPCPLYDEFCEQLVSLSFPNEKVAHSSSPLGERDVNQVTAGTPEGAERRCFSLITPSPPHPPWLENRRKCKSIPALRMNQSTTH
ncbi:hypothetical protein, conserved [Angomonas deanei]|uniref:Uncharacterized protein n=1 Tax=Angomonas deanei TaxID=59799 RepID=A0A7G2C3N9_9TRYP|nr:hypothetical protein, conserved [Angomonas deanei]